MGLLKFTDDDCNTIMQDWSESDPDQMIAIGLASEVMKLRDTARLVDKYSIVIFHAVKQVDPEMYERVCSALIDLRHAAIRGEKR